MVADRPRWQFSTVDTGQLVERGLTVEEPGVIGTDELDPIGVDAKDVPLGGKGRVDHRLRRAEGHQLVGELHRTG